MILISGGPIRLRHALLVLAASILTGLATKELKAQGSDVNTTPEWHQAISHYSTLAESYPTRCRLTVFGHSDVGRPLHLFLIGDTLAPIRILVNNAIHPGEPCGVNACMDWASDILDGSSPLPENVCIAIVPMYNVGGGLRRNCCTRANQMGPEEYGFRGNARNLDLNRDFIKCDSRNALSFNRMFTRFNPDIFVDTHTSNGADYQPAMTLIATQPDKLGEPLGSWSEDVFNPLLYSGMEGQGEPMIPYVNSIGATPDEGIVDFLETPRYSTGYGALNHTLGYTTEAHMLKPFSERVQATRAFLQVLTETAADHATGLREMRQEQHAAFMELDHAPVGWEADTTAVDSLDFPGYAARYEWSNVTGERRLKYDRKAPYTKAIPHLHTFKTSRTAPVPAAYIVPQAWRHVLERLEANGVASIYIPTDTTLVLEVTTIERHSAYGRPYEGHHYRTVEEVSRTLAPVQLFEGDRIIPTDQAAGRYLVETLSPEAVDAFMAWNFFDSALQQKEYFSPYVFEETAEGMLESNSDLNAAFELARQEAEDAGRPWSSRQQLDWIYQRSPHTEGTASRYPVFAVPKGQPIPFHD